MPLQGLVTFATDRPDDLVEEVYFDPESRNRIEVWRAGSQVIGAKWTDQLLFESFDLADFAKKHPPLVATVREGAPCARYLRVREPTFEEGERRFFGRPVPTVFNRRSARSAGAST